MRRLVPVFGSLVAAAVLAACSQGGQNKTGADTDALGAAISKAIGGQSTCVLIMEPGGTKPVYQYGATTPCGRGLPTCQDEGGLMSARDFAALAAQGVDRAASCDSSPGFTTAWASGPITGKDGRKLVYAAVMDEPNEKSLPGREIKARLEPALVEGGL